MDPNRFAIKRIFTWYKRTAKRKKITFDLSLQKFTDIIKEKCFYCGRPPTCLYTEKDRSVKFFYNSIDRLKTTWGYIPNNIVTACKTCNNMKSDLPIEAFLAQVFRVYKNMFEGKK